MSALPQCGAMSYDLGVLNLAGGKKKKNRMWMYVGVAVIVIVVVVVAVRFLVLK
jgi:Tfp pilus assembly protein PilN